MNYRVLSFTFQLLSTLANDLDQMLSELYSTSPLPYDRLEADNEIPNTRQENFVHNFFLWEISNEMDLCVPNTNVVLYCLTLLKFPRIETFQTRLMKTRSYCCTPHTLVTYILGNLIARLFLYQFEIKVSDKIKQARN